MAAADALEFLKKKIGRGNVAAFALNGLDDNSGHVFGIEEALENLTFELLKNFRAAIVRRVAERAAVGVGIRNVLDAAEQRAESFALRGLRSGHR